ncbi:MAG TPA: Fur family transcriptional regulator [Streptomyces sp.]|uniref:Fur family transcriptional regulator n=1 Tax=Streptomyces sp. TaxID=1931 RepID=UPI002CDB57F4|nr:Fur family transcriptional regulator [Streptomyces sp.]HWU09987.1 Fur family transcriptional regulator [Streptomyces sp.]
MFETEAKALLRGASLRVTRPRAAVLSAVHEAPHSDAGALLTLVRTRIGAVSTQAVYDVLRTLVDAGLARRIDLPNSPARYEGRSGDGHRHVVCRSCGTIADVDVPQGSLRIEAPQDHGFTIDHAEVTYWGLCPGCRTARSAGSGVGELKFSHEEQENF